jgi:hypothetical protein
MYEQERKEGEGEMNQKKKIRAHLSCATRAAHPLDNDTLLFKEAHLDSHVQRG